MHEDCRMLPEVALGISNISQGLANQLVLKSPK